MRAMIFCNVGWMRWYQGLVGRPDKIVGGGRWVDENKTGGEVCNFQACPDGYVYGHVETISGKKDRQIRIEALGGAGESVDGVDVVWTATDPDNRGRRVVGWYRGATLFRRRQHFPVAPSRRHARDRVASFMVRVAADNAHLLDLDDRELAMGRGPGWMGHTQWWVPSGDSGVEVRRFVTQVVARMEASKEQDRAKSMARKSEGGNSPGAPSSEVIRYIEKHELTVTPRHHDLQTRFEAHLKSTTAKEVRPNLNSVDLRYRDAAIGPLLVEVKPCEAGNARYAIRTAIGQLLDYRQDEPNDTRLLIVVEVEPAARDCLLATSNGVGIAYPEADTFRFHWPNPASN